MNIENEIILPFAIFCLFDIIYKYCQHKIPKNRSQIVFVTMHYPVCLEKKY